MKILLINNHTKNLDQLIKFLPGEVIVCDKEKLEKVSSFEDYGLIVFSGGSDMPTVMRHPDLYSKEISIIKGTNLPILGICLGAEIINVAFGGTIKDLDKKFVGEYKVSIKNNLLKEVLGDNMNVFEGHNLGIDTLPECFDVFAYSERGIEVFKHKNKLILGLQFHPELSNNEKFKNWIFDILK